MAVDFYTQNFCSSYTSNFYEKGELSKKKIEEYGKKFGLTLDDLKGTEKPAQLAKILYEKQLKVKFNGTDPIKNQDSAKNNSLFSINEKNTEVPQKNQMNYKGQKLNIIG